MTHENQNTAETAEAKIERLTRLMDDDYKRMTGGLFDLDWHVQNAIDLGFAPQAGAYYGDIPDEVVAEAKRKEQEREAADAANGVVWEHLDGVRFDYEGSV